MMYLLIVLCSCLLLRIPNVSSAVATDPSQGTSTFSIIYDFSDNNTPGNSRTIALESPDGNPNDPARLSYTVNYRIAPIVPGAALTNEVAFSIGTTTSDVILANEPAPIAGTAGTTDVVAGVISGSALVSLGSDLVIAVTTATDSNAGSEEGTFTGFVTYTMELEEGGKRDLLHLMTL